MSMSIATTQRFSRAWRRTMRDRIFAGMCLGVALMAVGVLLLLLGAVLVQGLEHLDLSFLRNPPSRHPDKAGLAPALWGSIYICIIAAIAATPVGVGTAILLEEYRPRHIFFRRLHAFIELNIRNLAGVPSIVYGVIGLTVFVEMFRLFGNPNEPFFTLGDKETLFYFQIPFGRGLLAGGLTLALVILPIIVVAAQESLRAVPNSLREGAFALGATRWRMISRLTLPISTPGVLTGVILAMSRAIGEAAPVLVIGGILFIRFLPRNLMDDFTAMPLQIYDWAGRPQEAFHHVAATGIIVLLAVLLTLNGAAVFIRHKLQRPIQ